MSGKDFALRSRAALAEHFPDIATELECRSRVEASVIFDEGEPVDISVDGKPIYGGDARRFAAGQVEAYMKKPLRFFLQRLDLSGMVTGVGWRLIGKIDKGMRAKEFGETTTQPADNPTFLIVFGLGLGHHVEELVRATKARWLIIVEPLVEFIEHSCEVIDWAALTERFKSQGGSIHFVTESDPHSIVRMISGIVNGKGVPYTDGSWVFTHYPHWAFTEARDQLHGAIEFIFVNRGYYEDELIMMTNAVTNYATRDFWLLENRPRLRRPEIAVVVGAGPSLDESIETLRQIRDHVVVFSAGTSLRVLLRNGIVPDFHCELENGAYVAEVLKQSATDEQLSQITLLASNTVHPTVPPLFGETIFYFRDSVSPTQILGRGHREIYGTGPTCVNLALTCAAVMGFTDFALFGTDCGTRPGSSRHAKGTIYSDIAKYHAANVVTKNGSMQVPGNFGGIVQTEIVYDLCRVMLGDTIRHYGLKALNCSDGALIVGARPCVPEALQVGSALADRAAAEANIKRSLQHYMAGQILKEANIGEIRRKTEEMFTGLDRLLETLGDGEPDFAAAYDRVMGFVENAKDKFGYTESIISGSLQALPRIAMFYGFRVAEADGRRRLFDLFIAEFRAIATDMAKNIYALFEGLETHLPSSADRAVVSGA